MNRSSPSTTPAPAPRRVLLALTLILVVLIAMAHIYDELLPSREPPGPEEPPLWTRQNELPVDLSRFFNNDGIASQAEPNDTNFDCPDHPPTIPGSGYPAEELPDGASVFRAEELDASFLFPVIATGEPNNVACKGQRITDPSEPGWLDAGHGCTAIAVLGAAENGAARAKVTLEYEDGSVATRTLSFPDWCVAPETGAVVAWSAPYRYAWDQGQGRNGRHEIDCHLYAARLSVDGGRRLAAIRLPEQPNLHIFALTLQVEPGAVEIARRGNALAARYRKVAELADQPPADLSEPVSALAAELEAAESRVPPDLRRPLVWLETQYEYLTHKIGRRRVLSGSRTEEWARTWMTAIRSDLAELLAGVDPFDDRRGNILKGYVSDIDGRIQPYTVYVPDSYTPGRPTPLVVHMHGHGWYRPFQGYPTYPFRDAVVLSPHGRGSMDYMFVGEEDVLDAIAEVEQDYTIDRRRVYLLGSSMGGTGCWNLGTKYPDRFAAVGPIAANADSRAWADVAARHPADTGRFARLRRRLRTKNDPVTFAGNLLHTTIYFLHGAEDRVVPVENSRSMARALERAGCSFTYREGKRGGHGWKPGRIVGDQHDAIFAARLTERPRRVQLRAGRLKHGRAFWLRILRFGRRDRYGEVNAEVSDGSLIQVRPSNVTAFEIDLARCPIDTAEAVAVTVDGVPVFTDMVSARS
ncbi:MAG: prolyl oligopeptidase family serine peptidase, partial [Planctomycetota bacterium]